MCSAVDFFFFNQTDISLTQVKLSSTPPAMFPYVIFSYFNWMLFNTIRFLEVDTEPVITKITMFLYSLHQAISFNLLSITLD